MTPSRNQDDLATAPAAGQQLPGAGNRNLAPTSRALHLLGALSASVAATVIAAGTSLGFLLAALFAARATPWLTAFEALAAAVTLVMVFTLQHTQSRQQAALQRKLDEILRVLPGTDPRAVHLETGSAAHLDAFDERHTNMRDDALGALSSDSAQH